jgi:hypothetical protein
LKPSHFFTDRDTTLRVRITKRPVAKELEPYDVSRFEVGKVYEVGPRLAEILIVAGFAEPETRTKDRPVAKPGKSKK